MHTECVHVGRCVGILGRGKGDVLWAKARGTRRRESGLRSPLPVLPRSSKFPSRCDNGLSIWGSRLGNKPRLHRWHQKHAARQGHQVLDQIPVCSDAAAIINGGDFTEQNRVLIAPA